MLITKEAVGAHYQGRGVLVTKEGGCSLPRRVGRVLITKEGGVEGVLITKERGYSLLRRRGAHYQEMGVLITKKGEC